MTIALYKWNEKKGEVIINLHVQVAKLFFRFVPHRGVSCHDHRPKRIRKWKETLGKWRLYFPLNANNLVMCSGVFRLTYEGDVERRSGHVLGDEEHEDGIGEQNGEAQPHLLPALRGHPEPEHRQRRQHDARDDDVVRVVQGSSAHVQVERHIRVWFCGNRKRKQFTPPCIYTHWFMRILGSFPSSLETGNSDRLNRRDFIWKQIKSKQTFLAVTCV